MSHPSTPSPITSRDDGQIRNPIWDLVLRTSYFKLDGLRVPVFADKNLKLSLQEGVSGAWLFRRSNESNPDTTIGHLANALHRALSAGIRFEPLNDTPLHRNYPSPRSLFPVQVIVVFCCVDAEQAYVYDPEHHGLLAWMSTVPDLSEVSRVRIDLVPSLARIAPLYGEFAITLCALEAGHVAEELCSALREEGVGYNCFAGAPEDSGSASQSLVLAHIILPDFVCSTPSSANFLSTVRTYRPTREAEDVALVELARLGFTTPLLCGRAIAGTGRQRVTDGLRRPFLVRRSSGRNRNGLHGEQSNPAVVEVMQESISAEYEAFFCEEHAPPSLLMLRPMPDRSVRAIYHGLDIEHAVIPNGCAPLAEAYGTAFNIDLQTIPLILIFSAPFALMMSAGSTGAYFDMLVRSGAFAQVICRKVAIHGFYARPFKGHIEQQLETAFRISGQAFYTLLLGKGGDCNLSWPLHSLGVDEYPAVPEWRSAEFTDRGSRR